MVNRYISHLDWLSSQKDSMCDLLYHWANINSGTYNLPGLATMLDALRSEFTLLGGQIDTITLPPYKTIDDHGQKIQLPVGRGLHISKRRDAKTLVFLGGHMDTVYGADHPFQSVVKESSTRWCGPGLADMKGGLVVMLKALQTLEQSPWAQDIGWEVFINPDEEIGSPGSVDFLHECGRRNDIGLVFEPSFSDGTLVSERKGSAKITAIAKGQAAHAGRDMASGRNAITALARFATKAAALTDYSRGTTVNVGWIRGGEAVNIVPDFAICRCDIRVPDAEAMTTLFADLEALARGSKDEAEGIQIDLFRGTTCPPKPFDGTTKALFEAFSACGKELDLSLSWRGTGGVCDGNKLSYVGLPTIDTLGVRGGNLHTPQEYIELPSLTEKAMLVALYLMKIGSGELAAPSRHHLRSSP